MTPKDQKIHNLHYGDEPGGGGERGERRFKAATRHNTSCSEDKIKSE